MKNKEGINKMKTLVIYDEEGYLLSVRSGEPAPREPIGVPFLWVSIPEGKQLKIDENGIGVDVSATPHQVILEDIPPSEIDKLKAENTELMLAVAELGMTNAQNTRDTQLAIAELANLITGGNE